MPSVNSSKIRKKVKSRQADPLYLIVGIDNKEKSKLVAEFVEMIDEELRAFNVDRFYGGESSLRDVINAAGTLPMMAPRRVVLVFHAEKFLMPKKDSIKNSQELENLEAYIKSPHQSSTVVFVASDIDKRRRINSLLWKTATVIECDGFEESADARRWVRSTVASLEMEIEEKAIKFLLDRSGLDIVRLRDEVDRLLLYSMGRKNITISDAQAVVGPMATNDDWAVTRAIEKGSVAVALKELALSLDNGAVPQMILGQLGWVARTKLPPKRVAGAVRSIFRTDIALKTSAGDSRVLLERLVIELCLGSTGVNHRARPLGLS